MDAHDRHAAVDYGRLIVCASALIVALCVVALTIWLLTADVSAKAFDADGTTCFSRALHTECAQTRAKP